MGGTLTTLLQEHDPPRKHPALTPAHPIPQIVQRHLLPLLRPRQLRHRHRTLRPAPSIRRFHRQHRHGRPPHRRPFIAQLAAVGIVVLEEPRSFRGTRRRLHLHGEVAPWEHRVRLAVRVGHFLHLNLVERDADPHPRVPSRVVDEDEFAAFALGKIAVEGGRLLVVFGFAGQGSRDAGVGGGAAVSADGVHAVMESRGH